MHLAVLRQGLSRPEKAPDLYQPPSLGRWGTPQPEAP